MKISTVAFALLILSVMLVSGIASEEHGGDSHQAGDDADPEEYPAEERDADTPLVRVRRGFGCPLQSRCNSHCQSIQRRAGYCDGPLKLRCVCTT
ncbi:defensin-like [Dermacentor silvarum]|uniref:defensin-like n=1 Tax=Dermacentor silvarum TaxID=543639 RepID=UPI0021009F7A|nr:defensin-like [Dermacentor silvarum]